MSENNNITEFINSPLEPIFKPKFNKSNIIVDNKYNKDSEINNNWLRDGDNYKKNNNRIIRGDIKDEDFKNNHISYCFMENKDTCNKFLKYLSSDYKTDIQKKKINK
jgi:hypothetical protein